MRIAWAGIHRGEEPSLCGPGGSGTVFFTGCTLKCFFCQNHQLSREKMGRAVSPDEFATLCLMLQEAGAENINLVTGTQFIPSIIEGLTIARARGLNIPILWNSSGFENLLGLSLLAPWIDVYLPDLKTLDPSLSREIFHTDTYPDTASRAICKMAELRPPRFEGDQMAEGVIVRHLVLPGLLENTREVLEWYSRHLRYRALLSVMFQYTPLSKPASPLPSQGEWNRKVTREEYNRVLEYLEEFNIRDGYIQELPGEEDPLPDFSRVDAFPPDLAKHLWSWTKGLVEK